MGAIAFGVRLADFVAAAGTGETMFSGGIRPLHLPFGQAVKAEKHVIGAKGFYVLLDLPGKRPDKIREIVKRRMNSDLHSRSIAGDRGVTFLDRGFGGRQ